ncbi:serine--tRNA ligase [Marinithermus hydrothermalis]|uniref:Serine--tRNA ligase n=1 Tax=Marinithermus hydrothermalis (strain DSM 14884 / JCM 11576 / T1) TaxID=869210 RepID=F2NK19_MARHT|nr:serine--tRNA ligase [Marinithermus hydrothermalis]AEB11990.1 Seryl-tRNA synthetase [Marinithermus hydrothermalis DSM 14884]
MLDIKFIREHPEQVKEGIRKKGELEALPLVEAVLELDARRRQILRTLEAQRAEQKRLAKEVGRRKAQGEDAREILEAAGRLASEIKALEAEERTVAERLREALLQIPNLPHPSVPEGADETGNQVVKTWGEPPGFDFEPKPHWELARTLGLVDFERGAKVTGSGFPFFVGDGARLVRGLVQLFLDFHAERGFTEVHSPLLVNRASAIGTAQLPDKEGQMYEVSDGFYLIPTAETSVTNLHRDEILPAEALPLKYAAYTPCFRREAGSYGKDVRGLNRLHQFDKVEMVVFEHPDRSYEALEWLTREAEELLELLGLPYRRLLMCTGDMGFAQAKKYDLEVWSAGQGRWLEVSSVSNFEAYQARRMNLRFREPGGKPQFVHTLNGSGLALPRVIAALLEHNQDAEGNVHLPEAVAEYVGKRVLKAR